MSAMSSWPARDRKYGKDSEYPNAPRHGGRRTGKFNELQEQFSKMTQAQRVLWHRKHAKKRLTRRQRAAVKAKQLTNDHRLNETT